MEQLFVKLGWQVFVSHELYGQSGIYILSRSPSALAIGDALKSVGLEANFWDDGEDIINNVGSKPVGKLVGD